MNNSNLIYRALLMLGLTLVATLLPAAVVWQPLPSWLSFLKGNKVHLGLDLQGGTHLVLTVDVDKAVENSLDVNADELRRELPRTACARRRSSATATSAQGHHPGRRARQAGRAGRGAFPNLKLAESETDDGNVVQRLTLLAARRSASISESAVEQSLETIRNRIDQFGVTEPIIQRQGDTTSWSSCPASRIPERAKELIGSTAVLEFKLVRDVNAEPYADGTQPLPAGTQVLYELAEAASGDRKQGSAAAGRDADADDRRRRHRRARAPRRAARTAASSRSTSTRAARSSSRRSPAPTSAGAWPSCSTTRSTRRR